jgi:hypothetical protein
LRAYALEVSFERYSLYCRKEFTCTDDDLCDLPFCGIFCAASKKPSAICQSTASYNLPSAMLDLTALRAAALQTRRNASDKVYIEEQEDGELVESTDLSPDEQRNQTNIKGNLKHH